MRKYLGFLISLALLIVITSSCSFFRKPASELVDPEILAASEAVKFKITQEGMYRVRLSDLGWEENAGENISLTHKGQPIPYELQNIAVGPALVFFGQASSSPYTSDNFYVLEKNTSSKRLIATQMVSVPEQASANIIMRTVHAEDNQLYVPKVDTGSSWHWLKIVAPQVQSIEVDLDHLTAGPGRLRAAFWGITTAPSAPDHHIRVSINGQTIGETSWDGQTWQNLEAEIPAGVLIDGKNTIEIQATGEGEVRIDIVNLDWVEIDYPKKSDQLEPQEIFRIPAGNDPSTALTGALTIFEISNPAEISRLEFPAGSTASVTFQADPNQRYLSVTEDGYLFPDQILPLATEPDLRTSSGASYLAIGHPVLLEPLEPLLEVRREQGLTTMRVPVTAIYDQFNGGMPEPEAIQAFLAFAAENWDTQPEYVLLVGDTSYDYYGYQTPLEANFVPTFLVPTIFGGETGSDVRMVQFAGALSPALAIGRVPARSVEQVETFVAKTLIYEQNSPEAGWKRSVLAIADGQEPSFKEDANRFIEQFSAPYQTQLIAPDAGAQGTNEQISAEIENGTLVTAYFGHGSVNMWGKDSLFTTQDSAILHNGDHLPVVLNFTCLTGLFTHPTQESLAESLLFNPNGGAVAVLAPTSPTLPGDQSFLSNALAEAFTQDPLPRLGDITLFAWQQVPTELPGTIDVMQTFLLFGDPALVMP